MWNRGPLMIIKIAKNIFLLCTCAFLITSIIQFIPIKFQINNPVYAESIIKDDPYLNINLSVIDNVTINSNGEIKLAMQNKSIEDNFYDDSKISFMENIELNIILNEAGLIKKDFIKFYGKSTEYGIDIKPTSDGGYIIAGCTQSFGAGLADAWIIKVDEDGNKKWNYTYGGSSHDWPHSIQHTSDNGFVFVGISMSYGINGSGDLWITKINEYGIEGWNKTYGTFEYDRGSSVQITMDGGFIIVGEISGDETGVGDLWLIKTDLNGNELWNRTFGGSCSDRGYSVRQTTDNGFIILGTTNSYGAGKNDIWLIRTDSEGKEQWNKTFGDNSNERADSILLCSDNGFLIRGSADTYVSESYYTWLIKTDENGIAQWNRTYNGDNGGWNSPIQPTIDGGYIFTGAIWNWDSYSVDFWIVKIDNFGNIEWEKTYGGEDSDRGTSIHLAHNGGYVLTGHNGHEGYHTGTDVFFLKIDLNGNVEYVNGELLSNNLLAQQYAASIDMYNYNVSIPIRTSIKAQFSQDNNIWYNSDGDLSQWDQLFHGFNSIDLSNLDWSGSNFYYRLELSSQGINSPSVNYIKLTFSQYVSNGTFTSKPFNNGNIENFIWKSLNWTSIEPVDTDIKFQLRSSNSKLDLLKTIFVGPNGDISTYYDNFSSNIWSGHENDTWLQYKIFLSTNNPEYSPVLTLLEIAYNQFPTVILDSLQEIQTGNITIRYEIFDFDDKPDRCDIFPEYSLDNITFFPTSEGLGGDGKYDLKSDDSGFSHEYIWDSNLDLKNIESDTVYFKITPQDSDIGISYTSGKFKVDNKAPTITSVNPIDNSNNIDIEINISANFSESIINTSAENSFSIYPSTDGEFSWNNNTLIFDPKSSLHYNITYTIKFGNNVTDLIGHSMNDPYIWKFTTLKMADKDGDEIPDAIDAFPDDPLYYLDTDFDGIPDEWEEYYNLNKSNPNDANENLDDDNLNNRDEFLNDTDPWKSDIIEKEKEDYTYIILINIVIIIIIICLYLIKMKKKKRKGIETD